MLQSNWFFLYRTLDHLDHLAQMVIAHEGYYVAQINYVKWVIFGKVYEAWLICVCVGICSMDTSGTG